MTTKTSKETLESKFGVFIDLNEIDPNFSSQLIKLAYKYGIKPLELPCKATVGVSTQSGEMYDLHAIGSATLKNMDEL